MEMNVMELGCRAHNEDGNGVELERCWHRTCESQALMCHRVELALQIKSAYAIMQWTLQLQLLMVLATLL